MFDPVRTWMGSCYMSSYRVQRGHSYQTFEFAVLEKIRDDTLVEI